MKAILHKVIYGVLAVLIIASFFWLDYYLPEMARVTVTGVGAKRMDGDGIISQINPADGPTRDVYFIYTQTPDGQVNVYRNEDTGWGWPPYFKFDSADIQGKAQALSYDKKQAVITSYGWRVNFISAFPNVVDIYVAEPDESLHSIRRWAGFLLWLALWGFVGFRLYKYLNKEMATATRV